MIQEMGMGDIINSLSKTDESLKMKQQKKNEEKMRVQQNINKMNKRKSEMSEQLQEKPNVPLIESNSKFKPI